MPDAGDNTSLPPLSGETGETPHLVPPPPPAVQGYEVTGLLGRGGMGTVWRALQQSTRREVALKVLHLGPAVSGRALARFEREVELAARLQHAHIAQDLGRRCLLVEYLDMAAPHFTTAHTLRRAHLGEVHPDTLASAEGLVLDLKAQGRLEEAAAAEAEFGLAGPPPAPSAQRPAGAPTK